MSMIAALGRGLVQSVTVRSQITPDVSYDPWAVQEAAEAAGQPEAAEAPAEVAGGSSWIMRVIKPEVVVHTAGGPIAIAPYGRPTTDVTGLVALAAIVAAIGVVAAIVWISRATA